MDRTASATSGLIVVVAACLWVAGCATGQKVPSYYKTTLADPHPYPVQVIRTLEKPVKQSNGMYLLTDPNGLKLEVPQQYVKSIERERPERDKNNPDLFESRKPKEYKPSQGYFRGPFEFR